MTATAETNFEVTPDQLERIHDAFIRNAASFRKNGEHLEATVSEWYAARLAQAMKEERK